MKKTYLALAVAAVVASPLALAQDYQMEAGLSYVSYSPDVGPSDSAIGVDFTYYLETVSTDSRPLAEAAFLGRNSNINGSFTQVDKADYDTLTLGGEFWFEDIYVAAELDKWDDGLWDEDGMDWSLKAGYMLNDGFLAYVGLSKEDWQGAKTAIHLGAKYVADMGGNFINLEGNIESNDGETFIDLRGDYFFSNELSAGLRVSESSISGDKTTFGVGAKYFFAPTISGEVEYATQDSDNVIGLRVAARF